jgi:hypothetical protein
MLQLDCSSGWDRHLLLLLRLYLMSMCDQEV